MNNFDLQNVGTEETLDFINMENMMARTKMDRIIDIIMILVVLFVLLGFPWMLWL